MVCSNCIELFVTDIKNLTNKRRLIYINYEPAFALYSSEINKFNIKLNSLLENDIYNYINSELLSKRAIKRSLGLLKNKDYTETEIADKLKLSYYPDISINKALVYLKENNFINDRRYAENYICFKAKSKSRKQIEQFLYNKGIQKSDIEEICERYYGENSDAELELILKQIKKSNIEIHNELSYEEKNRIISKFYRKGFNIDTIKKAVEIVCDIT